MTENSNAIQIRDMTLLDIDGVVDVHRHCFPASISIFSVLKPGIVKRYYELFVSEPESLGAVLVESGTERIAGFTAGTLRPGIKKRFAIRYCIPLCWSILLGCLTSDAVRKVVYDHLKSIPKMFTEKKGDKFAEAEGTPANGPIGFFMPIAIHPDFRGGGNAVKLAEYLTNQFFKRGVVRIRGGGITTDNIASRKLFEERLGWNSKVVSDKWVAVWIDRSKGK
ncbi:MAG TPA: GNAT family N-acetyltransferase [Phycisphaerales bacterium]|nr:GNAT family N-acetyltransferase [Phycisphaerales bacterium]